LKATEIIEGLLRGKHDIDRAALTLDKALTEAGKFN
jgi:hypothetical protein